MALRELIASFDVDTGKATSALKKVDGAIEQAKNALGALATAFVGSKFVHGIGEFIESQIEAGSAVNDMADKLGVGVDELQAFQLAAGLVGVGAEESGKALGFLNKNLGEAIDGNKEAVETFAKLGISLDGVKAGTTNALDLVPDLADKFAELGSDAERTALAMKLFGKSGASLLPFLKGGREEAKKALAEFERLGGGMSKEFVKAADEAGDEIDKVKFALNGWKSQLAFAILPVVTHVATKLQGWVGILRKVTRETHLAKEGWVVFGLAAGAASAKAAAGFAQFLGILPKDAGFWKTILGLGEIGLVVAGVALLVLIFEDLFTFLTGGESIIGDLITEFLGLETANMLVEQLRQAWSFVSAMWSQDLKELKPVIDLLKDAAAGVLPKMVAYFVDITRLVSALIVSVSTLVKAFLMIPQALADGDLSGYEKLLNGAKDTLFGDKGLLSQSAVGNLQLRNDAKRRNADVTESVRLGGLEGRDIAQSFNQTNKIDVTVQGGANPRETGGAVKDGVKDALGGAIEDALGALATGG